METTTYSDFRKDLEKYMDKTTRDYEPITITRKNCQNAVLISEKEYNNMLENRYLLENPTNQEWLQDSLVQAKRNKDMVIYPAIFSQDGNYTRVHVPDLQGGFTQGNDPLDAVTMAEDLIGNLLADQSVYPQPSNPESIKLETGESLVYISVDLAAFRIKYSKTVRKNVTIPEYLNEMAKEQKINVSQVVTEALKTRLGV